MKKLIRHIEKRVLRAYEFTSNALYYWQLGYGVRTAIRLARDTIRVGRW